MGELLQGGIVFYSGTTVLIAALNDIQIPLYWDNFKNAVSGTSTAIGSGSDNTTKIISVCTGNTMIAASLPAWTVDPSSVLPPGGRIAGPAENKGRIADSYPCGCKPYWQRRPPGSGSRSQ